MKLCALEARVHWLHVNATHGEKTTAPTRKMRRVGAARILFIVATKNPAKVGVLFISERASRFRSRVCAFGF